MTNTNTSDYRLVADTVEPLLQTMFQYKIFQFYCCTNDLEISEFAQQRRRFSKQPWMGCQRLTTEETETTTEGMAEEEMTEIGTERGRGAETERVAREDDPELEVRLEEEGEETGKKINNFVENPLDRIFIF